MRLSLLIPTIVLLGILSLPESGVLHPKELSQNPRANVEWAHLAVGQIARSSVLGLPSNSTGSPYNGLGWFWRVIFPPVIISYLCFSPPAPTPSIPPVYSPFVFLTPPPPLSPFLLLFCTPFLPTSYSFFFSLFGTLMEKFLIIFYKAYKASK